jgi:hypothetical protein
VLLRPVVTDTVPQRQERTEEDEFAELGAEMGFGQ